MEIQERNGFSILGFIAQVLLVVIFVFVLMLLFPTKSYIDKNGSSTLTGNAALTEMLFNQNLLSMKDAAREYYTVKRMPATNGSSKTLTLEEMIKNRMVVEFVDAYGEKCDQKASFVKVTKVDSEYEMEVSLTCGKTTKSIKTVVGCYNYCESGLCEKEAAKVTLYQYSKLIKGTSKWSNWSEWSLTKVEATSTRQVETKVVNEITGTEVITSTADATITYTCPDGFTKSEDGKTCIGKATEIPATLVYYCADGSDVIDGNKCAAGGHYEYQYKTPSCKNGYLSSDKSKCVIESAVVVGPATPGVFTTLDSCKQQYSVCATSTVSGFFLYCDEDLNANYINSNNQCMKRTVSYTNSCPDGYTLTSDKQCKSNTGTWVVDTENAKTKYTCAQGEVSGNVCILANEVTSTMNTTYSCSDSTMTLNENNLCEKSTDVYGDVTYYRFRTYTTTKDTVVYKWSKSNNDTALLKAGYKLTGKTKTTTAK